MMQSTDALMDMIDNDKNGLSKIVKFQKKVRLVLQISLQLLSLQIYLRVHILSHLQVFKHFFVYKNFNYESMRAVFQNIILFIVPGERQFDINDHNESSSAYYNHESGSTTSSNGSGAGLMSVLIILAFFSGIALWVLYAYKNPQSSSGQFLIRYRPSQWRWGSSEARYTAASIHM